MTIDNEDFIVTDAMDDEFDNITVDPPSSDAKKKAVPDKKKHTFELDLSKNEIVKDFGPGDEEIMLNTSDLDPLDEGEFEVDDEGNVVSTAKSASEEPKAPKEDTPKPKPVATKPEKSRAQERIRELANANSKLKSELTEKEKLIAQTNKIYAELELKRLDQDLSSLKSQLEAAYTDGDAKKAAEIVTQFTEKLNLRNSMANAVLQASGNLEDRAEEGKKAPSNNVAPVFEEWKQGKEFLIDTPTYAALPLDQRRKLINIRKDVISTAKSLISDEGFDSADKSFYEELDLRLSLKYPLYKNILEYGVDALEIDDPEAENTEVDMDNTLGGAKKPHNNIGNRENGVSVKSSSASSSSSSNPKAVGKRVPVNGTSTPSAQSKAKKPLGFVITEEDKQYYLKHLSDVMSFEDYVREMAKTVNELKARKQY